MTILPELTNRKEEEEKKKKFISTAINSFHFYKNI